MLTILVTGGAGFIGSHLCERLLQDEANQVICLDNFLTGSRRNIEALLANPRFRLVEHDIIYPYFSETPIQQIYNLACPASPVQYQKNAIRTVKANTIGMINMLGLAKKHGARILQASTSEVYGDPLECPQKEGYRGWVNPIGPRACYDEGKRVAETLMFDYHRSHGLEIKVARIFNTYGPRMAPDDGRVVSNFIVQALESKPLTIYGDGNQTRSFCFVDDLVEGLMRLMNSPADFSGPVNLGNPREFTVKELADLVLELAGVNNQIIYQTLPEDDPRQRCPDIGLAKEKLGWQPQVELREGLVKTIGYFKKVI